MVPAMGRPSLVEAELFDLAVLSEDTYAIRELLRLRYSWRSSPLKVRGPGLFDFSSAAPAVSLPGLFGG
jgi:hypothetical protein